MQYFLPPNAGHFVGDCMPLFHDGTYHLYYLLDINHHSGKGGKGGHVWAHAASTDLVHWQHLPLAIDLGPDGALDDGSICTGSIFVHEGVFYAYYAARSMSRPGERVCLATSQDGVTFTKHPTQPLFAVPAGYSQENFRDPNVFQDPDDGLFHMLVCSDDDNPDREARAGCLAHLISRDLIHWDGRLAFVSGMFPRVAAGGPPECPDYFRWGNYCYILWGDGHTGVTRYLMADHWNGPWRKPQVDGLESGMVGVIKSAAFLNNRRIGVGFVRWRSEPEKDAGCGYAGHALFREFVQHHDGTLGVRFPTEMLPALGPPVALASRRVTLTGTQTAVAAEQAGDLFLRVRIEPGAGSEAFGLFVRGQSAQEPGYELRFEPKRQRMTLTRGGRAEKAADNWEYSLLDHVTGLDGAGGFDLEVVLKGDLIDVCVAHQRTLCMRFTALHGPRVAVFRVGTAAGATTFDALDLRPLVQASTSRLQHGGR